MEENLYDVELQMEQAGVVWRGHDRSGGGLKVDGRKHTVSKGGKWWYRLHTFSPLKSSRKFAVGAFGCYRDGKTFIVEWDRAGLNAEQLAQYKKEQAEARERERALAAEDARMAALSAADLWHQASRQGHSPYLERKGVEPESCRFLSDGSVLVPLLRYDKPRDDALRAVQRIHPGPRKDSRTGEDLPQKVYTRGFSKTGCACRLGTVTHASPLILFCEGYATGLSIRMATKRELPVFVCLDAYNLAFVVEILRDLYPLARFLICADDDWMTKDHDGPNPGRNKARRVAKATECCEIVWPVFDLATRQEKDTDFNDLHQRQGLAAVERQLCGVVKAILEGTVYERR